MPTTLTGLLLFVVLLLPGFAYVAIRERSAPAQQRSPLRETATVAAVSTVTNSAAAGLYALAHKAWPTGTPSLGAWLKQGSSYWVDHYSSVIGSGFAALGTSVVIAVGVALLVRDTSPHPSAVSSWWMLFESLPKKMSPRNRREDILTTATCYLSDQTIIEGVVFDFNTTTNETPDRDLILVAPIRRRASTETAATDLTCEAACVSARDITAIEVDYRRKSSQPVEAGSFVTRAGNWLVRAGNWLVRLR